MFEHNLVTVLSFLHSLTNNILYIVEIKIQAKYKSPKQLLVKADYAGGCVCFPDAVAFEV